VAEDPKVVKIPFENMHIKSEFPDYVYAMPRKLFEKWVVMQNEGAAQKCQEMADVFRQRNPYIDTYVQSSKYRADVNQKQSEQVSETSASMEASQSTEFEGKTMQQVYRQEGYGGGPLLVLNPYCDRPPKVMFKKDGTVYVADPDKVFKTREEAEKLIEKVLSE
jgi:uncharacterized Zn finger protein (UPF0148 family)